MNPKEKITVSAFAMFKSSQAGKSVATSEAPKKRKFRKKFKPEIKRFPFNTIVLKKADKTHLRTSIDSRNFNDSRNSSRFSISGAIPSTSRSFEAKKRRISSENSTDVVPCGNPKAEHIFKWLMFPENPEKFFEDIWEKKPLYITRNPSHYHGLFSCSELSKILENEHLEFGTNIDVVKYEDGEKIVQDCDGRAYGPLVWADYKRGYSVRLLNPQRYSKSVYKVCSYLQEYFGSFTGANVYLTPPGSQGFAPHYDDIEAFVLQIEGRKHWKVYAPRNEEETLPRTSSGNFNDSEIGEPIMEIELCPGDLLYFPRGFIHQACTSESYHSLHITISTCMKNTYGDLLKKILTQAVDCAMERDVSFRESLPRNYMNNADQYRDEVFEKTRGLLDTITNNVNIDYGISLMAKEYIHSSLPPYLSTREKSCSIHGNGERWENGRVKNSVVVESNTEIRFLRIRAIRLVREGHHPFLYHSFENSMNYREKEAQCIALDWCDVPAIEQLMESHPQYIRVDQLNLKNDEDKLAVASLLYDKGLIESRVPLNSESDDEAANDKEMDPDEA